MFGWLRSKQAAEPVVISGPMTHRQHVRIEEELDRIYENVSPFTGSLRRGLDKFSAAQAEAFISKAAAFNRDLCAALGSSEAA